jgi:hypothetical protein
MRQRGWQARKEEMDVERKDSKAAHELARS